MGYRRFCGAGCHKPPLQLCSVRACFHSIVWVYERPIIHCGRSSVAYSSVHKTNFFKILDEMGQVHILLDEMGLDEMGRNGTTSIQGRVNRFNVNVSRFNAIVNRFNVIVNRFRSSSLDSHSHLLDFCHIPYSGKFSQVVNFRLFRH